MPEETLASTAPRSIVRSGESLTGSPIRFIGKEMFLKLADDGTAGSITVLEDVSPAGSGPPLHAHDFEEWFYVVEGAFLFEADGTVTQAGVGDFVHVASGIPHTFQCVSETAGRLLILVRPGGVERYFMEIAAQMMADPANVAGLAAIGARYGVKVLGPPLAARRNGPQP